MNKRGQESAVKAAATASAETAATVAAAAQGTEIDGWAVGGCRSPSELDRRLRVFHAVVPLVAPKSDRTGKNIGRQWRPQAVACRKILPRLCGLRSQPVVAANDRRNAEKRVCGRSLENCLRDKTLSWYPVHNMTATEITTRSHRMRL